MSNEPVIDVNSEGIVRLSSWNSGRLVGGPWDWLQLRFVDNHGASHLQDYTPLRRDDGPTDDQLRDIVHGATHDALPPVAFIHGGEVERARIQVAIANAVISGIRGNNVEAQDE